MLSAAQRLIEIGRESCQLNGGCLHVDFTRVKGDYLHEQAPRTANGLGHCLPSSMMGEGAELSFSANGETAKIYFSAPSKPSKITIRQDGDVLARGAGPSVEEFKAACQNANFDQRCAGAMPTKVVQVFDYL